METVNRNIAQTFLFKVIGMACVLSSSIFVSRLLGVEGRGIFTLTILAGNLLSIAGGLNFTQSLPYLYTKDTNTPYAKVGIISILALLLISILALSILFWMNTGNIFSKLSAENISSILLLFLTVFLYTRTEDLTRGILYSTNKIILANKLDLFYIIMTSSVIILSYIIPFIKERDRLSTIFIALSLVNIGSGVFRIFFINGFIFNAQPIRWHQIRKLVNATSYTYLSSVMLFLLSRYDIWVVAYFESLREVGFYTLSVNFNDITLAVILPLYSILISHFSTLGATERDMLFAFYSRVNVLLSIIIGTSLWLASELLMPLLFGIEYIPSVPYSRFLVPSTLFSLISGLFSVYLISTGKSKLDFISQAVSLFIGLLLSLILYNSFEIYGIISAKIISNIVRVVCLVVFIQLDSTCSFDNLFILKHLDLIRIKISFLSLRYKVR